MQGITWRLGFGIDDPTQPEGEPVILLSDIPKRRVTNGHHTEWQDHPADLNLPLTADM